MKIIFLIFLTLLFTNCVSTNKLGRNIASSTVTGEMQIKGHAVRFVIEERAWNTSAGIIEPAEGSTWGGYPTLEGVRSYLIIHQVNSVAAYNIVKVESALKSADQCQTLGVKERENPKNHIDGYISTITSKIVNSLEMPGNFTLRYVCTISVLAAKK